MTTHDPIPARLAALKTTPTPDLKQQWRDLFDSEPPPSNRRYLESRLAYRIQELAYGGLKPETRVRLEALGEQLDGGNMVLRRIRADGRTLRDNYVFRVKGPAESKGEWDLYAQVATIPADEAFAAGDAKVCPLLKG